MSQTVAALHIAYQHYRQHSYSCDTKRAHEATRRSLKRLALFVIWGGARWSMTLSEYTRLGLRLARQRFGIAIRSRCVTLLSADASAADVHVTVKGVETCWGPPALQRGVRNTRRDYARGFAKCDILAASLIKANVRAGKPLIRPQKRNLDLEGGVGWGGGAS